MKKLKDLWSKLITGLGWIALGVIFIIFAIKIFFIDPAVKIILGNKKKTS